MVGGIAATRHDYTYNVRLEELVGTDRAQGLRAVQGRITEHQLPEAEQSMPGITRFYDGLVRKPATFLDLLWAFEDRGSCRSAPKRARKRSRR